MPIRYYPSSRIQTNLKTQGGEFTLNGTDYRGPYYETYDGDTFSGPDPVTGPSFKLTPIQIPAVTTSDTPVIAPGNETYNAVASPSLLLTSQVPKSFNPQPTDQDYKAGYFTRYFAKKRTMAGFVIEIDQPTYTSLQNADSVYDYITYQATNLLWQLTGPLYNTRPPGKYPIAGIIDTNTRLVAAKEPTFQGLTDYIGGNYTKFSKPS
jgi:hypothetical protein